MDAPRCRLCNEKHWGSCPKASSLQLHHTALDKPVQPRPPFPEWPFRAPCKECAKKDEEITRLRDELAIAHAKRAITHTTKPAAPSATALTNAQRQARYRAKKKEKKNG